MEKLLFICVLSAAFVIAKAQAEVPRCKWSNEANLGSPFVFMEADKCLDRKACTMFSIVLCCGDTENVMEKYGGVSTKHTLEAQATCNDRSPSALQVQDRDTSDRDTSDGDTSDRDTSDRDTSNRDTSDRDTSDRDTSDGDTSNRDTCDRDTSNRDTSDRDTSDGDTSDGDTSDRDTSDRDTSDRDTSDRDTSDRDTSDRDTSDRDTSDRDTSDGDTSNRDTKSIGDSGRDILRGTTEEIRASGSSRMLTAITEASLAGVALLVIVIFLAVLILCCSRWSRGTREKMPIQCSEE